MASSDEAVEQSLSSRTATPIAQLNPDLIDQATRKVHGEITITWPYSFVTKTFAFLLAESDFRLRRNKGQVRIQLKGPSAEAVGKLELGSGDEVTLALDGVEWAKDEESARPAGSRSEWQLKFAGKLMLKATLGETQETKVVSIDQPVPIIVPEAPNPIPFAEIDLTIFDAPLAAKEPPTPPAPANDDEFASPMFMKRSRAYEPLFELDLDDELEDDGGRKGKGRKRPRYSALNGRWRLNEDISPEPDQPEGTPSAAPGQNEDVEMQDTPARPSMADGGVQTNESDLAPVPSSLFNTPSKTWSGAGDTMFSEEGELRPHDISRIDWGVQATPSRQAVAAPTAFHEKATGQVPPNPFGQVTHSSGLAAFGSLHGHLQNQEFGNAPSAFGAIPAASSNQGFGGASSPFVAGSHGPSSQGFGENASPFGTATSPPADQALGQTPSLFGMNPTQAQSASSQVPDDNGFGATSGSVRFSFGQEPSSGSVTSPLRTTQAPGQYAHDPYPESSLDHQDLSNYPLSMPQDPIATATESLPYGQGVEAHMEQTQPEARTPEQGVPLWQMGSQSFGSSHAIGRANTADDLRSDGSAPERSPPGMIPPAVDDGTRNMDEMKQEGILSQPVYRQGVSQEALPGHGVASAGEEDDYNDSDEQAAYHDSEKGDDYDLRNYDRVSDDEEGFEDEEPLSDDELLDEGSEHWAGEESYEEDDYDEDEEGIDEYSVDVQAPGRFTQPQLPPQPPAQKDKVVIDLLSDSDDEESPVPPIKAPRSQVPPPDSERLSKSESLSLSKSESVDFSDTESTDQPNHRVAPLGPSLPSDGSAHGVSGSGQEGANLNQDEDLGDDGGKHSDEEHLHETGDDSEPNSGFAETDDEGEAEAQEAITVNLAAKPSLPSKSLNSAMQLDDGPQDARAGEEDEEPEFKESKTVDGPIGTDPQPDRDERETLMATDDDKAEYHAASFQTQPDEMIASFQFRVPGSPSVDHSPEDQATSDAAMEDVNDQEENQSVGDDERRQDASDLDRGDESEREGIELEPQDNAERSGVESNTEAVEVVAEEITTVENQENQGSGMSLDQQDEPSASPILQDQADITSAMSVVEASETTVISHAELRLSNQEVTLEKQETEMQARTVLSQPVDKAAGSEVELDHQSSAEEKDVEMVGAEVAAGSELDTAQAGIPQTLPKQDIKQDEAVQCLTPSDIMQEPQEEGTDPVPAPSVTAGAVPEQTAQEKQRIFTHSETPHIDEGNADDDDEEFHDASEMVEQTKASPRDLEDSFASVDSQVSETHNAEEAETAPEGNSKRGGKKARNTSSSKSAKSTPASQKAQRQSSRQSSRQVSAQQAPSSQRTTRSKTMSFQAASPKEDKEDMSIQLARAALKSPTSKKRKVSATTAKRLNSDLVKRLENDLPDCVALKDLRKYNANFVDIAAVATSANVPPKRTPTREYASSFTVTDPSVAPDGVVEVALYSLHKDHLPVVKMGDSVLLRSFLVVSLPGRGFGLKTKDGSSWAVFKSEGDDEPEMKAAPVEMSDKEANFMLDVRAWYAGLDDAAKGKLGVAVDGVVAAGKESRANLKK